MSSDLLLDFRAVEGVAPSRRPILSIHLPGASTDPGTRANLACTVSPVWVYNSDVVILASVLIGVIGALILILVFGEDY